MSFIENIINVLIRDQRYKIILEGLKNTLFITTGGLIIGITLGTITALIKNPSA